MTMWDMVVDLARRGMWIEGPIPNGGGWWVYRGSGDGKRTAVGWRETLREAYEEALKEEKMVSRS